MTDARVRLEAMLTDLRANPRVEITEARIGAPTPPEELARFAAIAPPGVLDFYRSAGSFTLSWRHTVESLAQGDLSDTGSVSIIPIAEVYGDWEGSVWFPGDERFRDVRPFDTFIPEACAAFHTGPTVAYHYYGEGVHDTGRDFGGWFELMLASRGFWYWIETLCAETTGSHQAEAFRAVMPEVFPGVDLSRFAPK